MTAVALAVLAQSGALDGKCWAIMTALAAAVVAEAWFIRLLFRNLQRCQDARVKALKDDLVLVRTARREAEGKPPEAT